jgi:branched-chain amino acid aminotransferase
MAAATHASIDGLLLRPEEATISILDDGLLRGDGAFEAIKLYGGHPFRLDAHLERLRRSAAAIELDHDAGALRGEIEALIAAAGDADAVLRVVLTRAGRRILLVERLPDWPDSVRVAVLTLTPSQILEGVKSTSYAANMQATRLAHGHGADEAIFVRPDGIVLEAPTSSVFWADDQGVLHTPSLSSGILESITRAVVLEALTVEEGEYGADRLRGASEAFLASTTREIQPISTIDGAGLPEVGGPLTERASEALAAAVAAERAAAGGAG